LVPTNALERAGRMEEEGVALLDLGAESTRPGAVPVDPREEWRRLQPVIVSLRARTKLPLSVDTRHFEVAQHALEAGADLVNDVSCAADAELLNAVGQAKAGYVLVHSRGKPQNMVHLANYADVVAEVKQELTAGLKRALAAGIEAERIAIDPGIGFAKTPEQNWVLLGRLAELQDLGRPILVGVSRKRLLRELGNDSELELLSAGTGAMLAAYQGGARIFRVHDVGPVRAAFQAFQKATNQLQSKS